MASFTKRNGRWRARVRRSDLPPITYCFPTKASALKWAQIVQSNPEGFASENSEDHQLRTVVNLLRKHKSEVTSQKKVETRRHRKPEFFRGPASHVCHCVN